MSYRGTKLVLAGLLLTGVTLLTFSAFNQPNRVERQPSAYGSVIIPPASDGILTQCGDVFLWEDPMNYGLIPENYEGEEIPRHPMAVPVYGYMAASFDETKYNDVGFLEENPYSYPEIVRALWDGYQIIWYGDTYGEEAYDFVKDAAKTTDAENGTKTLVLFWGYGESLPADRVLGFSSWGASQTCQSFALETYEKFVDYANEVKPEQQNPPAVVLEDGKLPDFDS